MENIKNKILDIIVRTWAASDKIVLIVVALTFLCISVLGWIEVFTSALLIFTVSYLVACYCDG